ncbi:MAG: peptidase S10 [Gammaproteobacteria bacterium]|nr:peptidase S10 [Gammaproteobacteria bacterium]
MRMKPSCIAGLPVLFAALCAPGAIAAKAPPGAPKSAAQDAAPATALPPGMQRYLRDAHSITHGTVTVGGRPIRYEAEAGVMVVHLADPMDQDAPPPGSAADAAAQPPAASMSYVAYFKGDREDPHRPITFLYNGGPGSSTIWLHMGAFGPVRVVVPGDRHVPPAPYAVVNNEYSLLDASDLVFIDAPGTGFGHLRGKDKDKAFWGVDQDAHAFANFIVQFLSAHDRWNSPKFLFGESYGTTRSAALINVLENDKSIDFNGVILLSQILNFDDSIDAPQFNPGVDLPYELALPSYAATAWYHHKLPNAPATLDALLPAVEKFALGPYAQALDAGNALGADRKAAIAQQLHAFTGLPVATIERADLRINGGEFEKNLLGPDTTTGRLDARFTGPTLDPMSQEAGYDPQSSAIASAYVAAFNDYVRTRLKFGIGMTYKPEIDLWKTWDYGHRPPGAPAKLPGPTNVMPDLAAAMQQDPNLKVQLNGGYYDLATPFFAAMFEMQHLPMEASLEKNIEMHFYPSGHMVYVNEPALKALHANVAAFIERNSRR